jgi:hypothetical protein
MKPGQKENLCPVDVADPGDDALIHERVADGPVGSPQPLDEDRPSPATGDWIGTEAVENREALVRADELAGRGTDEIPRRMRGREPESNRRARGGSRGKKPVEVSEHPEVDVHDRPASPVVKEVLAPRLRALEDASVQASCLRSKTSLGGGGPYPAPRQIPVLLSGEAVKDRTFRHVSRPAGRAPRG